MKKLLTLEEVLKRKPWLTDEAVGLDMSFEKFVVNHNFKFETKFEILRAKYFSGEKTFKGIFYGKKELKEMDNQTWRKLRADYSVEELEKRFILEEERTRAGLSTNPHDKDFRNELRKIKEK